MLANHLGELKAVEVGHANVDQDDRDLVLEQLLERRLAGSGLDQIFPEFLQDHLIRHQLGRVIIDQENTDLLVRVRHVRFSGSQRCSHMRSAESSCSVLTGFAK